MRRKIISAVLLGAGAVEIVCGTMLLRPWYEGTATYVRPGGAFAGAIFLISVGGFMLAISFFLALSMLRHRRADSVR